MKKTITIQNNMIGNLIETLNIFKMRNNITCTPTITMAVIRNMKVLAEELKSIQECEQTIRDKYFTDETSHVAKDKNGNETRVLNDDCKKQVLDNIIKDLNELGTGQAEVEMNTIPKEDFEKLLEKNQKLDIMTPLEISFLDLIVEDEKEE